MLFNIHVVYLPGYKNHTSLDAIISDIYSYITLNPIQVIAVGITIGVGIHSIAHLACDFPRLIAATPEEYKPLGKYFGEEQPKRYSQFVKSTEGITGLVMVFLMAIAFTLALPWFRRGKLEKTLPGPLKKLASFNAFWYTHHFFIVVYILLIVHGYYLYLSKEWYKKTVSISRFQHYSVVISATKNVTN